MPFVRGGNNLGPVAWLRKMIADRSTYEAILAGKGVDAIVASWNDELREFEKIRSRYLLY